MVKIRDIELGEFPLLLAPMEGVTDSVFRTICKAYGADMVYTEFIAADGLIRHVKKSVEKLQLNETERPAGIQIYGNTIEAMVEAAKFAEQANPDVIDINFGCSIKKIASKGSGAGILNDIPKMVATTKAIVEAVKLPVTVKTRLGWDEHHLEIVDIAERLQDVGIEALSIHGRTKAQIYKGEADWTLIGAVKNNPRMHIPIFGNGDITSAKQAVEAKNKYGVDGIMIGRAAIGNPWIFKETKHYITTGEELPVWSMTEKLTVVRTHIHELMQKKGEKAAVSLLRCHYHNYFKGFPNFKPFRMKLYLQQNQQNIFSVLEEIEHYYDSFSLEENH